LPIVIIAVGFIAFFASGLNDYASFGALKQYRQELAEWTQNNRLIAVSAYFATYFLAAALSVPGAVWLSLAGGFLFGTVEATVYVVSSATLGAVVIFLAARYALGDYLRAKAGPAMRKMEAGFRENALSYLLVLRLIPIFPFWLVNLVPAFLGVPLRTYVIATFFGIMPGAFVYCSVGNGLGAIIDAGREPDLGLVFEPQILVPIIGLAVLSLIPVVYKRYKKSPRD